MEFRVRTSGTNSEALQALLKSGQVPYQRMETEGVDGAQVIEFVLTWGPPVVSLLAAIVDLANRLGKDNKSKITIDLSDEQ